METNAAVLSGFVLSVAAPWLYRIGRGATGWLLALLPLGLFAGFAVQIARLDGSGERTVLPWAPSLGLSLSLHADGLSLLMALVVSGIGAVVLIYAGGYLAGHPQLGRFYAYLLAFMASMLGLVLADNVVALFVFWELTSVTSYLLIGFDHQRPEARAAALEALLVTGAGGLALLAGLLLLAHAGGSYELSALSGSGEAVKSHGLYLPMLFLILAGAFTKSAQVPFHFWLPNAMEAPTPVSAYLHSATMVKAGVYLVARLSPVLGGTAAWLWIVTVVGGATMLVGASLAVVQTDLKRILAYSTVSALGILMLLLGLGGAAAATAAMAFLLAHALYKGTLFLVAGALDHETGTRDVERLSGLAGTMPLTALAGGLGAVSMAGLPPLVGFVAKELFYEATLGAAAGFLLTGAAVLASILLVAVAIVAGVRPFLARRTATPRHPHEAAASMWLGPMLLAILGLVLGLALNSAVTPLLAPAVGAVLGADGPAHLELALWHGATPALALSTLTLVGGLAVFALGRRLRSWAVRRTWSGRFGPARGYEMFMAGLNRLAAGQTRLLQSGYLRYYLLTIIITTAGLIGVALAAWARLNAPANWSDIRFYEACLAGLVLMAVAATVRAESRLAAIAALGVVGYGVALLFVAFGAPDLAMTQFLIETLTVILFVLVFYHLPAGADLSRWPVRLRDALAAVAAGGLMTAMSLAASQVQLAPSVSDYYLSESLPQAHGRNIVNVILVDFRGLDTLGEITVLAAAGIGVLALLGLRPEKEPRE